MVQLTKVRAEQIMEKDVLELTTLTPIDSAIELMQEYSISGAPVVDEAGELVGVLSASDIIKRDRAHNDETEEETAYYATDPFDAPDSEYFSREDYSLDVLGRELTVDWMTPKVVSVSPEATLSEVCALMAGESIHRVFVVEGKRLQGVISTLDIVNYLAAEDSKEERREARSKRGRKSTKSKTS